MATLNEFLLSQYLCNFRSKLPLAVIKSNLRFANALLQVALLSVCKYSTQENKVSFTMKCLALELRLRPTSVNLLG